MLDTLTVPNEDDFQIAEDIREGRINALLLKPLDYRLYRFHLYAAARLVHAAFAARPAGHRHDLAGPLLRRAALAGESAAGAARHVGAALIQFFFCFTLAMIAFWILDIGSVTFIIYSVEFLLGGHIFPDRRLPALAAGASASACPSPTKSIFPPRSSSATSTAPRSSPASSGNGPGSDSSTCSAASSGNAACTNTPRSAAEESGEPDQQARRLFQNQIRPMSRPCCASSGCSSRKAPAGRSDVGWHPRPCLLPNASAPGRSSAFRSSVFGFEPWIVQ